MNTLISYKLAVLLKEKGFNEAALHFYCKNKTRSYLEKPYKYTSKVYANEERKVNGEIDNFGYGLTWSAPIIADVVMWLYEKHGIWIYCLPIDDEMKLWSARIIKGSEFSKLENTLAIITNGEPSYKGIYSPSHAYELAIEKCLTKLIT